MIQSAVDSFMFLCIAFLGPNNSVWLLCYVCISDSSFKQSEHFHNIVWRLIYSFILSYFVSQVITAPHHNDPRKLCPVLLSVLLKGSCI